MKPFVTLLAILGIVIALSGPGASDPGGLSGVWSCDDGGTYYVNQVGDMVYWYGEQSPSNPSWTNVFVGRVEGRMIRGTWADVPKASSGNSGTLQIEIMHHGRELRAIQKAGGFGGSSWRRM
jgi:hypothetical protein